MNKIIKYIISLFLALIPLAVLAYEFEDPFLPMLPKKEQPVQAPVIEAVQDVVQEFVKEPVVNIQGVLWGTDMPMAIIDGEIYKVGAIIKGTDAKIHKIEKNNVIVIVKTQIFTLTTKHQILDKEAQ